MYNKPITQRIAFARSKKPSALKQTDDTTVLKKEIPVIKDEVTVNLPDTTETITTTKENPKLTEFKERCGKFGGKNSPEAAAAGCVWADDAKDPEPITTTETKTKPGGTATEEKPQYMYDYGDSMPSYMQRKYYRGLKVGERQQKKALKAQLKAKAITKEEYKQGLADAATQRANAAKAFAETQAEAARQGQMFGKQGTTKIGTFDPNVRVSSEEGTVGRQRTLADVSPSTQAIENQKQLQKETETKAAVDAAKNEERVNKVTAQENTANKEIEAPEATGKMKVGPLKMKSSFKMGGFGSKTYKK